MEVVEYEPNRVIGMVIREGHMETDGRATFEEVSEDRTRLTIRADMPIDESMKDRMTGLVQRSLRTNKASEGYRRRRVEGSARALMRTDHAVATGRRYWWPAKSV
jgi:hypothetical protein